MRSCKHHSELEPLETCIECVQEIAALSSDTVESFVGFSPAETHRRAGMLHCHYLYLQAQHKPNMRINEHITKQTEKKQI